MDSLIGRLNSWLWERDPPEDIAGRVLLTSSRYLYAMLRELSTGELNMRAMSLVYTTMLAIVPLLALIFSILKGFGYHERMEPLLQAFLEPLGPRGDELTATIIGFVDNVQESALAGISLALLRYTQLLPPIQRVSQRAARRPAADDDFDGYAGDYPECIDRRSIRANRANWKSRRSQH